MSVNYDANFGVGYKVERNDVDDIFEDYLDEQLSDEFEWFHVGSGSYTGDVDDVYIVAKDPLSGGLDLSHVKIAIDKELERIGVSVDGDFGIVGGLHVW